MKKSKYYSIIILGIILCLAFAGCQNPFLQIGKDAVSSAANSPFAHADEVIQGDGTEENPFLVYDIATLKRVGSESAGPAAWDLSKYYLQIKDIKLDKDENWTPIGRGMSFTGTYDGNGKTISGLTCEYPTVIYYSPDYIGLFSSLLNGTVKGLGIVDAYIKGENQVGGVAGANFYGTIQNCFFKGTVKGECRVGGIAGYSNGVIENCYTMGSFSSDFFTGGIVGSMVYGIVKNCYSSGDCSVTKWNAGGIVGSIEGDMDGVNLWQIFNCYSTVNVVGGLYQTGGIAGGTFYNAALYDCVALNQSVSDTGYPFNEIGRVLGSAGGPIGNNYAWSGMMLNNVDSIIGSDDDENGEGIAASQYNDFEWWTSKEWHYEGAWDFDTVWEWDADRQLPVLKGVGGQ